MKTKDRLNLTSPVDRKALELLLRRWSRKGNASRSFVGHDSTHYEGVCKGEWLAFMDCASDLKAILEVEKKVENNS